MTNTVEEIEWQTRRVTSTAIEAQIRKEMWFRGECGVMSWKEAENARERAVNHLRRLQVQK